MNLNKQNLNGQNPKWNGQFLIYPSHDCASDTTKTQYARYPNTSTKPRLQYQDAWRSKGHRICVCEDQEKSPAMYHTVLTVCNNSLFAQQQCYPVCNKKRVSVDIKNWYSLQKILWKGKRCCFPLVSYIWRCILVTNQNTINVD